MERLPVELMLPIIEQIDESDIVHLQQVSKYFDSLIRGFDMVIWRSCLKRQCLQNGQFWPTYKDLSTGAEFKDAATKALRFARAYERALTRDSFPKIWKRFDKSFDRNKIKSLYLVPGGRFLIVFKSSGLALWDLCGSNDGPPSLLLSYSFDFSYLGCVHVTADKILILVKLRPLPTGQDEEISVFELQEIKLQPGDVKLSLQMISRLCVVAPLRWRSGEFDRVREASICGNRVTFSTWEGKTFIWDFVHDRYAGWNKVEGAPLSRVYSGQDGVIYVSQERIYYVQVPVLHPIQDGFIHYNSFLQTTTTTSTFSSFVVHHPRSFTWVTPTPIILLGPCEPIGRNGTRLYMFTSDLSSACVHRFRCLFDDTKPISETPQGTLELEEVTEFPNSKSVPGVSRLCCGQLATLWSDSLNNAMLISMTPPTPSGTQSHILKLAKPIQFQKNPLDIQIIPGVSDFCPVSGKAVIVCELKDDLGWSSWIEVSDFLSSRIA